MIRWFTFPRFLPVIYYVIAPLVLANVHEMRDVHLCCTLMAVHTSDRLKLLSFYREIREKLDPSILDYVLICCMLDVCHCHALMQPAVFVGPL